MFEITKLIDVSKCTGCRGCQVACKQWNQLPAKQTLNRGTYQNPPDLEPNTWTMVMFQEVSDETGALKWLFRKTGCMHCTDASCVKVCPSGALYYTNLGTVGLNRERCVGCKECVSACPFEIPKYDGAADKVAKCDLCLSRIERDLPPACVKACPTGALQFGDKETILETAYRRAQELGGSASVYGDKFVKGTHVLYVLQEKSLIYAGLPLRPTVPLSIIVWKDILKPLSLIAGGSMLVGTFLHYILRGPKTPDEDSNTNQKEGGA